MSDEIPKPEKQQSSPELLKHLDLLQSAITRMAANSSACKGWAIALVSAVLAFLASTKSSGFYGLIAAIPLMLFLFLDTYYLFLERQFRNVYDGFVSRLHEGKALQRELFVLKLPTMDDETKRKMRWDTLKSDAIWPFYTLLAVLILVVVVTLLVLGTPSCGDFRHPLCPRSEAQPAPAAEVSGRDAPTPVLDRSPEASMSPAPLKPPTPSPATP